MLRNLGLLGRGRREGRPCGNRAGHRSPRPAPLSSGGEDESLGSWVGPPGSPFPRRGPRPRGGCGVGASGLAGNRIPLPRPCALGPAGAPPPPFRPLRGNRFPAQVLSFEALNEAFQKFFKLPRLALTGSQSPPSLHPRYSSGQKGVPRGSEGGRPKAPGSKRRPEPPSSA